MPLIRHHHERFDGDHDGLHRAVDEALQKLPPSGNLVSVLEPVVDRSGARFDPTGRSTQIRDALGLGGDAEKGPLVQQDQEGLPRAAPIHETIGGLGGVVEPDDRRPPTLPHDLPNRFEPAREILELEGDTSPRLGTRAHREGHLCHDSEQPLAPHEELLQVRARCRSGRASRPQDAPVREHHLEREHDVFDTPVKRRELARGAGGNPAADRRELHRLRPVADRESFLLDLLLRIDPHRSRTESRDHRDGIEVPEPPEAPGRENEHIGVRTDRPTAARTSSERHERNARLAAGPDHVRHLVGRLGEEDRFRGRARLPVEIEQVRQDPGVVSVVGASLLIGADPVPEAFAKLVYQDVGHVPFPPANASSSDSRARTASTSRARRASSQPKSSAIRSAAGSTAEVRASGS